MIFNIFQRTKHFNMKIKSCSKTDVGKVRSNNEDAYFVSKIKIYDSGKEDIIYINIVLDGMGGLSGGELASYLGGKEYLRNIITSFLDYDNDFTFEDFNNIEIDENKSYFEFTAKYFGNEQEGEIFIKDYIKKDKDGEAKGIIKHLSSIYQNTKHSNKYYKDIISQVLDKAIKNSNKVVNNIRSEDDERDAPGTTLTSAVFFTNKILLTNIGDSRAYRYRITRNIVGREVGEIKRITKDHSYVQELVDNKMISQEDARKHPNKNIVTRCIGVDREDIGEHFIYTLKKGDMYLFSTDGLHDLLSDKRIENILYENKNDLKKICSLLINEALDKGGFDNVTTILAVVYE